MKNSQHPSPPGFAKKAFAWWAKTADTEDLLGDLDEDFLYNVADKGKFKAQLIYFRQVASLAFSYTLRKRKDAAAYSHYYSGNSIAMIRNYFKIAIRNFSKQKLFTSINIIGLALGMSICVLALSIGVSIFRFDEFQENKDRIYQVNTSIADKEDSRLYASTFNATADFMSEKYPFVEKVVKVREGFSPEVLHKGNTMHFNGYFADATFFDVFTFPLLSGDAKTALAEPFSVVLTRSTAETLFKNENPIGQVLESDYGQLHVTGVMDDLKETHFYFQLLTSHQTFEQINSQARLNTDWVNFRDNYLYLLLKPGTNEATLTEALAQVSAQAATFHPNQQIDLQATQLGNVIPTWNVSNGLGVGWDLPSLLFFMAIGCLILLPAIFNYTNLSIARALKRAREIGIRKVVGAGHGQIKMQFIVETILLTFLALLGSLLIFYFIKPEFLDMVMAAESLDTSFGLMLVIAITVLALVIGLLAGIFPALYFSRLNPVDTLKGEVRNRSANVSGIKKGLFVFQFFLSLVFIIGVAAIGKQYAYVFSYQHGFNSDNVLAVPFQGIDKQVLLNEFKAHPDVKSVTTASHLPGVFLPTQLDVTPNKVDTLPVKQVFIGEDFIEQLHMKLAWGEGRLTASNQNEEQVLVNQAFIQAMGVFETKSDSLTFTLADGTQCRIVGALEDFNFEPLNEYISPLVFRHSLENSNYALLTISSTDIKRTIGDLDAIWMNIDQKPSFEATFLDDEIEKAYYFMTAQIKIFSYLSAMAITISCLGLLGMVAYTTENRTKEIAIRKIMGATNKSLYYALTKDFVRLIVISAMLAIPFAYFFYDYIFLRMLLKYGSGVGVIEIVASVLFLFLIGFASIYWQTSKVANANPAQSLRYE